VSATIIDGEAIAREIRAEAKTRVEALLAVGCRPGLAVVIVGDDPASVSYVKAKTRACERAGVFCETISLADDVSQHSLLGIVRDLNADTRFHGLLVQQPLPVQIDPGAVVSAVLPKKDVDGLHPLNLGLLLRGTPRFVPCTPAGIVELLLRSGNDPEGKRVVILGRSALVGTPLAALLMQKRRGGNATVTVCHTGTRGLGEIALQADILVAAVGRAGFVSFEMVREGAVVIDVGINRVVDPSAARGYRLAGDVDFEAAAARAGAITPVPGGVGPMTVAMLVANTVQAAGG
jgi:methylenetetrahydrofolate dehydrogenase (NADP+)/methenyltetrahydrofolate cyclohydrolase